MDAKTIIEGSKETIESKILELKKKYELLYSAAKEQQKKADIVKTIQALDRDLNKLSAGFFEAADLKKYNISMDELKMALSEKAATSTENYKIIRNIIIEKMNPYSTNKEINAIWTFLNFFGREYLGLLSEQNLPLDYGHAYQRDQFFNEYNQVIRAMLDYGHILELLDSADTYKNNEYKAQLSKNQAKEYRDCIIKAGAFLRGIEAFVNEMLESENGEEKVLLDPEKVIEIKGANSCIDGLTARKALLDLQQYIQECIAYIKLPDLKKIENEDA